MSGSALLESGRVESSCARSLVDLDLRCSLSDLASISVGIRWFVPVLSLCLFFFFSLSAFLDSAELPLGPGSRSGKDEKEGGKDEKEGADMIGMACARLSAAST